MTAYQVTIEIDKDIPEDVLTEHIGAALKQFRTEAVPATSPRVTVRKLADGGVVPGNGTYRNLDGKFVAPPQNGDKIVYDLHGPTGPLIQAANIAQVAQNYGISADTIRQFVEYTEQLPVLYDNFNGRQGRQHPFDGPVVFDDDITVDSITSVPQNLTGEMYPKISELIRDLNNRESEDWKVKGDGEGDWQISTDDKVGDDID